MSPNDRIRLDRLTWRELEIINGIAEGKTVKEIANELGLSYSTVTTHVDRISRKIGLEGKLRIATLTKFALRVGIACALFVSCVVANAVTPSPIGILAFATIPGAQWAPYTIAWDNIPSASGYFMLYGTNAGRYTALIPCTTNKTTVNLNFNTSYYFQVVSVRSLATNNPFSFLASGESPRLYFKVTLAGPINTSVK